MTQLTSKHHTLIQALLSRGPLKEDEFHAIFFGVTGKDPVTHRRLFDDFLLQINKELSYVQFELRGCRNQYDGRIFYGVVNNLANEQSKFGTKYSVLQIAFFRAIAEAIVHDVTNQGFITSIDALNIHLGNSVPTVRNSQGAQTCNPYAIKSFSKSQKEKTVNQLIQDQWLCYTSHGKIGLGVRSFLDFRSWFHNNDIPSCDVCNEAGVKASTCPNKGCTVRMHDYCLMKKFSEIKGESVCPRCSTAWPVVKREAENHEDPVGTKSRGCKAKAVDDTSTQARTDAPPPPPPPTPLGIPTVRRSMRRKMRVAFTRTKALPSWVPPKAKRARSSNQRSGCGQSWIKPPPSHARPYV